MTFLSRSLRGACAALALLFSLGAAPEEGFVSLFDGKDLSHWMIPEGDGGHWKVIDGQAWTPQHREQCGQQCGMSHPCRRQMPFGAFR